jgi:hypothetical protein
MWSMVRSLVEGSNDMWPKSTSVHKGVLSGASDGDHEGALSGASDGY